MSDTTVCHVARLCSTADLRQWAEHDWTDALQLDSMTDLEHLSVCTRNTTYDITVLSPSTGEMLIRGGRFFPATTRARLAGASIGGSVLKVRAICPGFLMEVLHEGRTIVTTRVQSVAVIRDAASVH